MIGATCYRIEGASCLLVMIRSIDDRRNDLQGYGAPNIRMAGKLGSSRPYTLSEQNNPPETRPRYPPLRALRNEEFRVSRDSKIPGFPFYLSRLPRRPRQSSTSSVLVDQSQKSERANDRQPGGRVKGDVARGGQWIFRRRRMDPRCCLMLMS